MKRLVVISHAPSENTRQLRDWVLAGARDDEVDGVDVRWCAPLDAGVDGVLSADALILGTTANFGYMSGALKDFFDRVYEPLLGRTHGLPFALFVRGRSDATGARLSVERIVTGLKWRAVCETLQLVGPFQPSFEAATKELGMGLAAGLALGIFGR